jgi:FixJ family two-component response regulator
VGVRREMLMEATKSNESAVVHVIDDDDSFRRSMTRVLTAAGFAAAGYRCVGEFLMADTRGDSACILLDISMPGPSGIDLLKALMERAWSPPVIFVTGRDDVITTIDVMKWGAFSYLLKPIDSETLLSVVRAALLADEQRRAAQRDVSELRARFATLTRVERAIFHGVVNNRLNKQLAGELGMCERTIKAQRARMFEKLHIRTMPELVRAAKTLRDTERHGAAELAAWPWFNHRPAPPQTCRT